jgi:hypothetical protein
MAEFSDFISQVVPVLHAHVPGDLVFWTQDELLRWLDDRVKNLAKKGAFVVRNTITLVDATATYDLPDRTLSVIHVAHASKPVKASSTTELEASTPTFATTTGDALERWYADRIGAGKIGLQPVPNAVAVAAAATAEVITHEYPATVDGVETITIPVPLVVLDMFAVEVIAEAYRREGDSQMPEAAQQLDKLAGLYQSAVEQLWGSR